MGLRSSLLRRTEVAYPTRIRQASPERSLGLIAWQRNHGCYDCQYEPEAGIKFCIDIADELATSSQERYEKASGRGFRYLTYEKIPESLHTSILWIWTKIKKELEVVLFAWQFYIRLRVNWMYVLTSKCVVASSWIGHRVWYLTCGHIRYRTR